MFPLRVKEPDVGGESDMRIELGDLDAQDVIALLEAHIAQARSVTPAGSSHTLDIHELKQPRLQFWVLRSGSVLAGCAALLELDAQHAELKSMRSATAFLRRGVARQLLAHLIAEARRRGFSRISLDTGSLPFYEPARRLYESAGFVECGPFADYREDPYKVFMTLEL
jgi:putative acetyltransferase